MTKNLDRGYPKNTSDWADRSLKQSIIDQKKRAESTPGGVSLCFTTTIRPNAVAMATTGGWGIPWTLRVTRTAKSRLGQKSRKKIYALLIRSTPSGDRSAPLPTTSHPTPEWLVLARLPSDQTSIQRAFSLLYDQIESLLQNDEYDELAALLDALSHSSAKIDPVIAVSGLRLTWIAKAAITNWATTRDRTAQTLDKMGHDSRSALAGLYD